MPTPAAAELGYRYGLLKAAQDATPDQILATGLAGMGAAAKGVDLSPLNLTTPQAAADFSRRQLDPLGRSTGYGGAIGAAGGGLAGTALGAYLGMKEQEGESPDEARARIIKNTLLGLGVGTAGGTALGAGGGALMNVLRHRTRVSNYSQAKAPPAELAQAAMKWISEQMSTHKAK